MKKMRFAVWFTALLAVFTFSSCLDSDNGGQGQAFEIVKPSIMGSTFQSSTGYELAASNAAQYPMVNTQYALIMYSYNFEDVTENKALPVPINLLVQPISISTDYLTESLEGMDDDMNNNAKIVNISATPTYSYFPVQFPWGENNMFMPIYYTVQNLSNKDEMMKELNSHRFQFFYDVSEKDQMESNALVLHVRHAVADPTLNNKRNTVHFKLLHFDLSSAVYEYESINNAKPEKIVIEFKRDNTVNSGEGNDGRTIINYAEILNKYKPSTK